MALLQKPAPDLAVQYANNVLGLRVVAIDTVRRYVMYDRQAECGQGDDKKKMCLDIGAEAFIDFKQTSDIAEVCEALYSRCHLIVGTRSGRKANHKRWWCARLQFRITAH